MQDFKRQQPILLNNTLLCTRYRRFTERMVLGSNKISFKFYCDGEVPLNKILVEVPNIVAMKNIMSLNAQTERSFLRLVKTISCKIGSNSFEVCDRYLNLSQAHRQMYRTSLAYTKAQSSIATNYGYQYTQLTLNEKSGNEEVFKRGHSKNNSHYNAKMFNSLQDPYESVDFRAIYRVTTIPLYELDPFFNQDTCLPTGTLVDLSLEFEPTGIAIAYSFPFEICTVRCDDSRNFSVMFESRVLKQGYLNVIQQQSVVKFNSFQYKIVTQPYFVGRSKLEYEFVVDKYIETPLELCIYAESEDNNTYEFDSSVYGNFRNSLAELECSYIDVSLNNIDDPLWRMYYNSSSFPNASWAITNLINAKQDNKNNNDTDVFFMDTNNSANASVIKIPLSQYYNRYRQLVTKYSVLKVLFVIASRNADFDRLLHVSSKTPLTLAMDKQYKVFNFTS